MTTTTAILFQYRCRGCWQPITAETSQSGTEVTCVYCETLHTVPAATDEAIQLAQHSQVDSQQLAGAFVVENSTRTPSDIRNRAKQRAIDSRKVVPNGRVHPSDGCAGQVLRILARFVDMGAVLIALVVGLTFSAVLFHAGIVQDTPNRDSVGEIFAVLTIFVPLIVLMLTNCVMLAKKGQTVGKRCMKIRVCTENGCPPGFLRGVIVRDIVGIALNIFVPFVGLISVFWLAHKPSRGVHDHLAGTYVVRT